MTTKRKLKSGLWLNIALGVLIVLPYFGMWAYKKWCDGKMEAMQQSAMIVIDKEAMKLQLISFNGEPLMEFGIACGQNFGNKRKQGDLRTPEGVFRISQIQDATTWGHDFGDGKGEIKGAYGPFFLRLDTPGHKGIGIHGTHDPASIGTRATEGCIRLNNDDLVKLQPRVYVGMPVVVLSSTSDMRQTVLDLTDSIPAK